MLRTRWISILTLVAILMMTAPVAAQAPNYYTSVIVSDVTSGAPVVGGTFTTNVSLSIVNNATPQLGVTGVELWLQFNDAVLAVADADGNPANGIQVEVVTEFFGTQTVVAANEVIPCPGGGMCVYLALATTGTPVVNRTARIARITWGALGVGPAGFVVTADTVMSDANGADVPINSVTVPTITILEPGIITGTVLRQGTRTDHANTAVIAYNTGGGVVANAMTNPDGTFELIVPKGGSYLVQASYNGYLKAQRTNVYVVGASVNIGTTTLRGGDVNGDNNINILDIVTIINRFGTSGWGPDEPADINDDGVVNIFDLTIAAGNFGRFGPIIW